MQLTDLTRPFMVLAPMDDVTDTIFRQIIQDCAAPDLCFTEFVNVDGLMSPGRSKLLRKLKFNAKEGPLVAQIWGKNPDNFREIARQIASGDMAKELGLREGVNFAGVDLNMGCPQKNEVSSGTCSALMNDRPLTKDIISATKEGLAGRLPLSIKTRTGFNEVDLSWPEFLLRQNIDMLTIHGRTKRQKSKVPANWEDIGKIRQLRDKLAPKTLIVGNGDVLSRDQALQLAEQYKLDGIMIGRGIFHDPYIFSKKSPWPDMNKQQRLDLFKQHVNLFAKTWQAGERPVYTLNKFCKIYVNGFDGAKELRDQFMKAININELKNLLESKQLQEAQVLSLPGQLSP